MYVHMLYTRVTLFVQRSGYNVGMTLRLRAASALAVALLVLPLAVFAEVQPQDEMHATIMAQLLQDPRTANIPPEQLQQLIDALARQADVQKVTIGDLQWQPHPSTISGAADVGMKADTSCASGFSALCVLSEGFGFAGSDPTIPLYFLVTSGLLILILARLRRHHELGHFEPVPATITTTTAPQSGTYV